MADETNTNQNTAAAPAQSASAKKRERKRNKANSGSVAPQVKPQAQVKVRLTKDEKYDKAQQTSTRTIERLKNSDDDGMTIVRTFGFSYELLAIADNLSLIQDIQNDMAKRMSRSVKTLKADVIMEAAAMIETFAADVKKLHGEVEKIADHYVAAGFGPRYAKDNLTKKQKQFAKTEEKPPNESPAPEKKASKTSKPAAVAGEVAAV